MSRSTIYKKDAFQFSHFLWPKLPICLYGNLPLARRLLSLSGAVEHLPKRNNQAKLPALKVEMRNQSVLGSGWNTFAKSVLGSGWDTFAKSLAKTHWAGTQRLRGIYTTQTYFIFVTDPTDISVEKKFVMWRNFKFLCTTDVEKSKISPHVE